MKNVMKVVIALSLIAVMLLCLVACGNKPSGEYKNKLLGTIDFSGDDYTYTTAIGSVSGTYSIDDEGNLKLVVEGEDSKVTLPTGLKYDKENDKVLSLLGDFTKAD